MSTTYNEYDLTTLTDPTTGQTVNGSILFLSGAPVMMRWELSGEGRTYANRNGNDGLAHHWGASAFTIPASFNAYSYTLSGGQMTLADGALFGYQDVNSASQFQIWMLGGGAAHVSCIVTDASFYTNGDSFNLTGLASPYVFATYSQDVTF